MKYSYKGLNDIKVELDIINFVSKCRLNDKDYIRKRTMMMNKLGKAFERYIIPIKPGRKNQRKTF